MGVPLRVVSYNIHSSKDDLNELASIVRGLAPDIVMVQEGYRRWRWRTKAATLAHSFGMVHVAGGSPSLGNLIFTNLRVRVTESWSMNYPLTPGRHMRGAAFARCVVPGAEPFLAAGSHLATFDPERPGQAILLKAALLAPGLPAILAADVNDDPGTESWEILADGLIDTGAGTGFTFPAGREDRRIDGVFVDPRFEVQRYQLAGNAQASDHYAVVVDLTV